MSKVGATVALGSRAPYAYRPYTFVVLKAPEMNAFAAPGGIIFVTVGMLKFLKNEDELAGVLGHEVAHVELRHGVRALQQEGKLEFLNTTKDVAVGQVGGTEGQLFGQLGGPMVDSLLNGMRNGYSVEQESEADLRSLEICNTLGYDAKAFARVIARYKQVTSSYGGAKYPADREAAASTFLSSLKGAKDTALFEPRIVRYQEMQSKLG